MLASTTQISSWGSVGLDVLHFRILSNNICTSRQGCAEAMHVEMRQYIEKESRRMQHISALLRPRKHWSNITDFDTPLLVLNTCLPIGPDRTDSFVNHLGANCSTFDCSTQNVGLVSQTGIRLSLIETAKGANRSRAP